MMSLSPVDLASFEPLIKGQMADHDQATMPKTNYGHCRLKLSGLKLPKRPDGELWKSHQVKDGLWPARPEVNHARATM